MLAIEIFERIGSNESVLAIEEFLQGRSGLVQGRARCALDALGVARLDDRKPP